MACSQPTSPASTLESMPMSGLGPSPLPPTATQLQFHSRLLTPCSDTEMLARTQALVSSPSSVILHPDATFDFSGPSHCGHDQGSPWQQSQAYQTFPLGYDFDSLAVAGFCDHRHEAPPIPEVSVTDRLLDPGGSNATVKHEQWDSQAYDRFPGVIDEYSQGVRHG